MFLFTKYSRAKKLNKQACKIQEKGDNESAINKYKEAISLTPKWAVPYYNLGLLYKYVGNWQNSIFYNRKAAELSPDEKDTWWNLGIAATALHDWKTAREAWKNFGIDIEIGENEISGNIGSTPVRLNAFNENTEVVWGTRIDPARVKIENIPFPKSGFRFNDIILNDGAPNGYRKVGDQEFPVFDGLEIWNKSEYSTYTLTISPEFESTLDRIEEEFEKENIKIEIWSKSVRNLFEQCSTDTPHEFCNTDIQPDDNIEIGIAMDNNSGKSQIKKLLHNMDIRSYELQLSLSAK